MVFKENDVCYINYEMTEWIRDAKNFPLLPANIYLKDL